MIFGKFIRDERVMLKMDQRELSLISGVSLRTIQSIERNEVNPTLSVLELVIGGLGYELSLKPRISYE